MRCGQNLEFGNSASQRGWRKGVLRLLRPKVSTTACSRPRTDADLLTEASDVRLWHKADVSICAVNVRY